MVPGAGDKSTLLFLRSELAKPAPDAPLDVILAIDNAPIEAEIADSGSGQTIEPSTAIMLDSLTDKLTRQRVG